MGILREEKFEIRNSKLETNSKSKGEMTKTLSLADASVLNFGL